MSSSLGRIALGVVGAVIGSFFGVPAIGFAIGSAIGGLVFAPDAPNTSVEGPRLGDTDVQYSSLGKIMPRHYGTTRTGGNVIWSAGLKEIKTEEEQEQGGKGGGGGGSSTTTTYSYFASFATALGRGPAQSVLRIWADGKLIYDVTGTGNVKNDKYRFRFRRGGPNQPVDPLIEESINRRLQGLDDINAGNGPQAEYKTIDDLIAEASASSDPRSALYAQYLTARRTEANAGGGTPRDYRFTPSYKELAYILFDDMPLEDFGNRIPNITAEVVWSSDVAVDPNDTLNESPITEISAITTVPTSAMGVDAGSETLLVQSGTQLRRFSYGSLSETFDRSGVQTTNYRLINNESFTSTVQSILGADANGNYLARVTRTGSTSAPIIAKIAPTSLDITGVFQPNPNGTIFGSLIQGSPATMDANAAATTYMASAGQNGARTLMAGCNPAGRLFIFQTNTSIVEVDWGVTGSTFTGLGDGPMCYGGGSAGSSSVYWVGYNGTNWQLYRISLQFGTGSNNVPTVNVSSMASGALGGGEVSSVFYDFATRAVFVLFKESGGGGRIHRYDPEAAGTVNDPYLQYNRALTLTPPNDDSGFQRSGAQAGAIGYANGTDAAVIDLSTGNETIYSGGLSNVASPDAQIYVPSAGAIVTWIDDEPRRIQFERLSTSLFSTDLATVLASICQDVGMNADEYSVGDIIGDHTVRGYSIARAVTGRKAMENLLTAYYVDGVETDWEVKFQNRSTTPVRTITENELGAIRSETGDVVWKEMRQPEYDLPREITMTYVDVERDYQQGSAHKRRTAEPAPSMYARKNQTVEVAIVFNDREARDIVERMLYLSWMSRDTAKGKIPWTHLDLDPTDIVQLSFANGTRIFTDRLAKTDVGANFEIEVETVRSGDPVYVSADAADVGSAGVPGTSIITPVYSKMFVFDIPLLEDYHDVARSSQRYYAAVGSDTASWLSADLFDSVDNSTFTNFDTAGVDVTWGQVIGDPLQAPRALWTTDRENTITVKFSVDNGDVNSVTRDDIINQNANRALIWNQNTGIAEIIQFQDVTTNPDGTKTLSILTRGLRGTDYMVNRHATGEFFIMLNSSAILPELNPLAVIGNTKYYKAVSRGALLATAQSLPVDTVGRDLYPYAPGQLRREDDGSTLTIKWNRRTRLGGQWNMIGTGVEPVPLNEDSEAYEFYLLPNNINALNEFDPNNPSTYVQLQNLGVEEAIVTAADLSSSGYTLQDNINVAVYQISAQVGRGFPRIAALAA